MDVAELHRQVEYKFAPEPLIAIQALANTYSFDNEEERLRGPDSARRWLVESELAKPAVAVTAGEFERLVQFRELVRGMLKANLDPDQAADTAALAVAAAEHPVPLAVGEDGSVVLDLEPAGDVDGVIAQMIGIVFDAQTRGVWPRLKVCAFDECRWAFYDSSKNRGGTWCRMEECGNRVKNRRYRERQTSRG